MIGFNTFILMYGDFPHLHNAILDDVLTKFPQEALPYVNVWCNQVCASTIERLKKTPFRAYESLDNVPKYPAMRRMFKDIDRQWILWLDDDTRINAQDWWPKTEEYIRGHPEAVYIGECWTCPDVSWRQEFIKDAPWYMGKPPQIIKGKPGVEFAIGGYWWLKTEARGLINWPDPRLRHCGGDTLLAEALRQHGFRLNKFNYGVATQQREKRRGLTEKPAGMGGYLPPPTVIDEARLKIWRGG